jgi:hypothetical protein
VRYQDGVDFVSRLGVGHGRTRQWQLQEQDSYSDAPYGY